MQSEKLPPGIDRVGEKFRARFGSGKGRVSKVFATLDEALEFRTIALQEIARGTLVAPGALTVAEWGRTFLHRRRHRASIDNDRQRWRMHVEPAFGALPLDAVSRRQVKAWLRALAAKKLAASTIRNCRSLLSVAYTEAIDEELLEHNPCARVRVDVRPSPISDEWYLLPSEQAALLAAAAGDALLRTMIAVAMGAGLRRGELFALHERDVHLEGASPYLMVRYGGFAKGGALKSPKNGKARRVALFGLALEELRTWLHLSSPRAQVAPNPHGLVFPTSTGARRVYSRDIPEGWKSARKAVTRIKPWWHLLRHTCASSLVAGWWGAAWSLEEVSKFLGHSSIAVTERYAHLAPSRLDERARAMPLVKVVTSGDGKPPKLLTEALSRPGDLNSEPPPRFTGESLPHDHPMVTKALAVLRTYAAGDRLGFARALADLAEALPDAARLELAEVGS